MKNTRSRLALDPQPGTLQLFEGLPGMGSAQAGLTGGWEMARERLNY